MLLNGAYIGIQVPQSAIDQFNAGQIWDVVPDDGGIVGGHCIYIVAFNATGPICVTWGQRQPMTWAFYDAYCDEAYGVVDNKDNWVDATKDPLDVAKLDGYLNEITSNPSPQPPQPPTPPTPPPCYCKRVLRGIKELVQAIWHVLKS
jgi:hypothetical protein